MIHLVFIYAVLLASAARLESRLVLNNFLERSLAVFTLAAAQLVLAVQILSLVGRLTGNGLLLAGMAFAGVGTMISLCLPRPAERLAWKKILAEWWAEASGPGEQRAASMLLLFAGGLVVIYSVLGALMIPLGDSYHYEMPLFWIQNHSIAPFVVNNPRINSTAFVDAALALPGYVYFRSGVMFAVLSGVAGILSLGVVVSLAGKLGCRGLAAACAGALLLGLSIFVQPFFTVSAETYLAGLWVGASLMFLMGCQTASGPLSGEQAARLGFSVLCFLMACGAKNTTVFLAPLFLAGLVICLKQLLFKSRILLVLAASGLLGGFASGTVWNYIQNINWYGTPKGPPFMQSVLSKEHNFRSVWTRFARGTTLLVFDTLWIPPAERNAYGNVCQAAVRAVGGKAQLDEDDDFYGFAKEKISPRGACGLVGVIFLLPAMFVGVRRMLRWGAVADNMTTFQRVNTGLLLGFGLGYFVMCHFILRWQSIGLWRLMPAFPVIVAPLLGLVMARRRYQVAAVLIVMLSSAVFLVYDAGMMARRFGSEASPGIAKKLANLSRQNEFTVECQWMNEAAQALVIRESYSTCEIPRKFMERVEPSTVIALVGDMNTVVYPFFGRDFSNQVVPLVDSRTPDQLRPPPADARYLIFAQPCQIRAQDRTWAEAQGYSQVFQALNGEACVFLAFKRNSK